MLYSIPYEYIGKKVDVRITDTVIEVITICLYGRKNRIVPLRSICQRIISSISNEMATASVSGWKG